MKEQFPSERKRPPCLPLQVTFTSSHQKYPGGGGCHPAPPALTGQTGVFLLLGRETAKGTTVVGLGEKLQIPGE